MKTSNQFRVSYDAQFNADKRKLVNINSMTIGQAQAIYNKLNK